MEVVVCPHCLREVGISSDRECPACRQPIPATAADGSPNMFGKQSPTYGNVPSSPDPHPIKDRLVHSYAPKVLGATLSAAGSVLLLMGALAVVYLAITVAFYFANKAGVELTPASGFAEIALFAFTAPILIFIGAHGVRLGLGLLFRPVPYRVFLRSAPPTWAFYLRGFVLDEEDTRKHDRGVGQIDATIPCFISMFTFLFRLFSLAKPREEQSTAVALRLPIPVVGLIQPGRKEYFSNVQWVSADDDWQHAVRELAAQAEVLIYVPWPGEFTMWEYEHVIRPRLRDKNAHQTVVFWLRDHETFRQFGRLRPDWVRNLPPFDGRPRLAVGRQKNGKWDFVYQLETEPIELHPAAT